MRPIGNIVRYIFVVVLLHEVLSAADNNKKLSTALLLTTVLISATRDVLTEKGVTVAASSQGFVSSFCYEPALYAGGVTEFGSERLELTAYALSVVHAPLEAAMGLNHAAIGEHPMRSISHFLLHLQKTDECEQKSNPPMIHPDASTPFAFVVSARWRAAESSTTGVSRRMKTPVISTTAHAMPPLLYRFT